MPCPIKDCDRLYLDDQKYAPLNQNQLAAEIVGMRGARYRRWPTGIQMKESELCEAAKQQRRITFLWGCGLTLLSLGAIGLCFKATLVVAAPVAIVATAIVVSIVYLRSKTGHVALKAVIDQIKRGQFQGAISKVKPLLNERFVHPKDSLYLNRNPVLFKDWVEAQVDRAHHNAGVHFESYVGTAMLIDAYETIKNMTKDAQFEALRQDLKVALRLASMDRIGENKPCEKAFAYVVLHRPLSDVKTIIQGAEKLHLPA